MQGKNSHACKASQIRLKTQSPAATATFEYFTRAEDSGLESFPQTVVSQLKITVSKTQHKNIQIKKSVCVVPAALGHLLTRLRHIIHGYCF
jgi:hypothetical protein